MLRAALAARPPAAPASQLCLLQVVPWWAQLWLHTLRLDYDGHVRSPPTPPPFPARG